MTTELDHSSALHRFIKRPWPEKVHSLRYRFKLVWNFVFPTVPLPVRLREGIWWLAVNDYPNDSIFTGNFELGERSFVWSYLKQGMTVLDVGAHHGLYTLLASKRIGPSGRVFAFEPSDRERNRLLFHLQKNGLSGNTCVSPCAAGEDVGEATLYVVEGRDTGCNSMRPPRVAGSIFPKRLVQTTVDYFLSENGISRVDFLKMDVEGAELSVLKGAPKLLELRPRPVILAEVDDSRTEAWGYPASVIYDLLVKQKYLCFSVTPQGKLLALQRLESYSGNLVAVPEERLSEVATFLSIGQAE